MKTPKFQSLASIFGVFLLSALSAIALPSVTSPTVPQVITSRDGLKVTMTVTAVSDSGNILAYQWYKKSIEIGGVDTPLTAANKGITGFTTNTLTISNVQKVNVGEYYVRVTEPGSATPPQDDSPLFTLNVNVRPKIAQQPTPVTKDMKQGASFSVALTDDTTTDGLEFNWQKNKVDINPALNNTAVTTTFTIDPEFIDLDPEAPDLSTPGLKWQDAGNYRLKIYSPLTNTTVYSKEVPLAVNSSPVILKQPAADTAGVLFIAAKASGKLSVLAGGNPKLFYQWEKENATPVDIAKAVSSSLTIKGEAAAEGRYRVRVSNIQTQSLNNSVPELSNYAQVIVLNKPTEVGTITPSLQGNAKGEFDAGINLTLTVNPSTDDTATDEFPLEFQWQKDSKNIVDVPGVVTGTNTQALSFSPLSWTDRGTYRCIVKNKVGTLTSKTFALKVNSGPILITPAVDTIAPAGGSASFTLVAGGNAPLKYQWFREAGDTDVSVSKESTSPKLTLSKLTEIPNQGSYYCVIKNVIGATTNTLITGLVNLRVDVPVKIDPLVQPQSGQVTTGNPLTLSVGTIQGDVPITFQWQRNNRDISDTTGFLGSRFVVTELDANGKAKVDLVIPVDATTSGSYRCIVSNADGKVKVTSATAKVVSLLVPFITLEPVSQDVYEESNVVLSVKASGTPTLKYQWQKRTTIGSGTFINLPGKTSATLSLPKVQFADQGEYQCVVSNATPTTATSAPASVVVNPIPLATITGMTPRIARAGDKVRITGTFFEYVKTASIGAAASFVRESNTSILLTVPATAPLVATPVTLTTKNGANPSTNPNLFTRSLVQANNINNPQLVIGTTFPPISGATRDDLIEVVYDWVVPKIGTYRVATASTNGDFQIFLATQTPTTFRDSLYLGQLAQEQTLVITTANTPLRIFVYGETGIFSGTQFGFQDFGPYSLTVDFLYASTGSANNSGFASTQGFTAGQTLAAQDGWEMQGDSASAQVVSLGDSELAASFTGNSSHGTEPTVLWTDTSEVVTGPESIVHAEWTMGIDQAGAGTEGHYGWQVTSAGGEPLGQVQFSVADGAIYLVQPDGSRTETEPRLVPGSTHRFEITTDLGNATWQARMDGVALGEPLPLPAKTGFGDLSVIWYPSSSETAQPTMTFDNVSLSVD